MPSKNRPFLECHARWLNINRSVNQVLSSTHLFLLIAQLPQIFNNWLLFCFGYFFNIQRLPFFFLIFLWFFLIFYVMNKKNTKNLSWFFMIKQIKLRPVAFFVSHFWLLYVLNFVHYNFWNYWRDFFFQVPPLRSRSPPPPAPTPPRATPTARLAGLIKFLIPKFIKSFWEEYQVLKRGRKYHGCREEYNVEKGKGKQYHHPYNIKVVREEYKVGKGGRGWKFRGRKSRFENMGMVKNIKFTEDNSDNREDVKN